MGVLISPEIGSNLGRWVKDEIYSMDWEWELGNKDFIHWLSGTE